jgi:signal transduction histidine kinase
MFMAARFGSTKDRPVAVRIRPRSDAHSEAAAEKFEELLAGLSGTFIRTAAENIDDQIELWLRRIVLSLGLDRGTVSQFDGDGGLYVTHQWARNGISMAGRRDDVKKYFPWLADKITAGELVIFSNLPYRLPAKAVKERDFVRLGKLRAHLTVPLKVGDSIIGGLSFATVLHGRSWSKKEIRRLKLVAEVFGNALERERAFAVHRRLEQDLRKMEGVALVGELATVLEHELRQPLTAILVNAETAHDLAAQENPDFVEIRDALADIIRDDARADEIIRNVRAMFRRGEAKRSSVDINDLLSDVDRIATTSARMKGISFSIEVPESLPSVLCNRTQLTQAILNLVFNAFDSVCDSDAPREVRLSAAQIAADRVRLSVRDRGKGIDPNAMPRVFEPFFTTKATGMGMGLAIVRSIIENHGGKIWAGQNPGSGATFELELPLEVKGQPAVSPPDASCLPLPVANAVRLDAASPIIVREVCNQFRLTREQLLSKSRVARIAFGRMLAMYLCRLVTKASLARIGAAFHRDHTTVLYAIRRIESTMMHRPMFQEAVRSISERVKGRLVIAYTRR